MPPIRVEASQFLEVRLTERRSLSAHQAANRRSAYIFLGITLHNLPFQRMPERTHRPRRPSLAFRVTARLNYRSTRSHIPAFHSHETEGMSVAGTRSFERTHPR